MVMFEARWSGPTAHTFLRNFFLYIGVKLTNNVVLISTVDGVIQLYIYVYLFFKFSSLLGCYIIWSRVPSAIQ